MSEKNKFQNINNYTQYLIMAIITGIGCGIISSIFNLLQSKIQFIRTTAYHNHIFLVLMPILGMLMVWGMKKIKQDKHGGTAAGIRALQCSTEELKPDFALGALFSLSLTNLAESAMVKEAGVFQMNIPFAHYICSRFFRSVDKSVAAACAVAAAFSAMWGLPFFGAFFAAEFAAGKLRKKSLFWGLISAFVAYPFQKFMFPVKTLYYSPKLEGLDTIIIIKSIALAILIGLFAIGMTEAFWHLGKLVRKIKNPYIRIAAGGAFGAAICLMVGDNDYLCGFNALTEQALCGELANSVEIYYAFALKFIVFTVLKKAGFKTGKLSQTWCIGALTGELIGAVILGLTPGLGAMLGLLGLFAATYNCPVSTIVLALRLFAADDLTPLGPEYLILFAAVILISFFVSGKSKIYHTQDLETSYKEEWNR